MRILIILLLAVCSTAYGETQLKIENAYIAEAPPGAKAMAAYMTIINPSAQTRQIISADSMDFSAVEIHTSNIQDGVAKMQQLESLTIPPQSKIVLSPGSTHLMLIDPQTTFTRGAMVTLSLNEADDTVHGLVLVVRKTNTAKHAHH